MCLNKIQVNYQSTTLLEVLFDFIEETRKALGTDYDGNDFYSYVTSMIMTALICTPKPVWQVNLESKVEFDSLTPGCILKPVV